MQTGEYFHPIAGKITTFFYKDACAIISMHTKEQYSTSTILNYTDLSEETFYKAVHEYLVKKGFEKQEKF